MKEACQHLAFAKFLVGTMKLKREDGEWRAFELNAKFLQAMLCVFKAEYNMLCFEKALENKVSPKMLARICFGVIGCALRLVV